MNLRLLNTFEREFGIPLTSISKEKFLKIFNDKNLSEKYFTSYKDTSEILKYLGMNKDLSDFVSALLLKLDLFKCEMDIDDIFAKYKEENIRETLVSSMLSMISSDNDLSVISATLCTLIALEDQNIEIYYNNVNSSIQNLIEKISTLQIEKSTYNTHCDILDLIIQTQFYWNVRYDSKIDIDKLDVCLDLLHTFECDILENSEQPSVDISPEMLGLLDITKLK